MIFPQLSNRYNKTITFFQIFYSIIPQLPYILLFIGKKHNTFTLFVFRIFLKMKILDFLVVNVNNNMTNISTFLCC